MNWEALVGQFADCRALVVGDICLDRWCRYDPAASEPSRETGIPRIGVVETETTPGAGGTMANNLAALGAGRVSVLGAIGQDGFGLELERSLANRNIDYRLLVASPEVQTFTYTKLVNAVNGKEDRPRLDFINTKPLPSEIEDQLIATFHSEYENFDVILLADQAETEKGGVLSDSFREVIADISERNPDKIVIADSRARIDSFRHVIAKPNLQEADEACRKLFGEINYQSLRAKIGEHPLVVTQGKRGALVVHDYGEKLVPPVDVENPTEVCGAGDSFAAGMALALYASGEFEKAVRFGNLVSSVTIMKEGTGAAAASEVLAKANSPAS